MKQKRYLGMVVFLLLNLNLHLLQAKEEVAHTIIDTLILYNQAVEDKYQGEPLTRINHIIEETNQRYQENQLPIQINPVRIEKYPMESNLSSEDTIIKLQNDPAIQQLREDYGADQVLIYRLYHPEDGRCGIAYVNSKHQSEYAFAHVAINCSTYYTSHELGHSMGLYHSEKLDPDSGYARGYGVEESFTTIMAYKQNYHAKKVYRFSNPAIDCEGLPCGVPEGEEHEANAYKALLLYAPITADFKAHKNRSEIEKITEARTLLATYQKEYDEIHNTLQELEATYKELQTQYQEKVDTLQANITNYYDKKRHYQKLQTKDTKEATLYYQEYLKPIINGYKKSTFTELYLLEEKLNKSKRSYNSYKNNVYLPAKIRLEDAKKNYLALQNKQAHDE